MKRGLLFLLLSIAALAVVLGLVFAGSPTKLAGGVTIDGIDVGGLEATEARALLQRRHDALANKPVVFVAGEKRYAIRPVELGVEPDWKGAVAAAQRQGDGFGPIRGFRRLDVRVFGADVTPRNERPERRTAVPARADRQAGEPAPRDAAVAGTA